MWRNLVTARHEVMDCFLTHQLWEWWWRSPPAWACTGWWFSQRHPGPPWGSSSPSCRSGSSVGCQRCFPWRLAALTLTATKLGGGGKKCTRDKAQTTHKLDTVALRLAILDISTSLSLGPPLRARNTHFTPRQAADLHTDCTLPERTSLTYVDQLSRRTHQTAFQCY